MKPVEAYNLAMRKIFSLVQSGISVNIKSVYYDKSHDQNYHDRFGVPPSKWVSVIFTVEDEDQKLRILSSEQELNAHGICFDKSVDINIITWFLNQSFLCKPIPKDIHK